ncbi:DUF4251 domain-containing protein [Winogradskyella eckloniae]|uniref:DUF4251 domain-containing protein n=1 Tax=Winogradskyella eckloniae TaxID=1089306 RepID=UPI00156318DE|nr:DUF4251 domain-containing protein [Winogradskyella eckloniae]NRD20075.1 DUF4251 domain-containing protein [Winogradskyella eckloniae]
MKKLILIALAFSLSAGTVVKAQEKQSQKEIFQPIYLNSKALVASENYQFVAHVIYNDQGRERLNADENSIVFKGSEVSGKLHSFAKDKSIVTIKASNSTTTNSFDDDNQKISVAIKTDRYELAIEVKPNGNAVLTITNKEGTVLHYAGKLVKP